MNTRHSRPRSAYTLMEMLIAMVLVSALMASAYGILSLYNGLLTAGKEQTESQQLIRSLHGLLEDDLNSVMLSLDGHPPHIHVPPPDQQNLIQQLQPWQQQRPEQGPGEFKFVGMPTAMRFTIRQPTSMDERDRLERQELVETPGRRDSLQQASTLSSVAEFQTIVWQLQPFEPTAGAVTLPSGLYRIQADPAELADLQQTRQQDDANRRGPEAALDQQTLEQIFLPMPDDEKAPEEEQSPEPRLEQIPEVVDCRFEYHDGFNWLPDWKDDRRYRLPVAIRISLTLVSPPDLEHLRSVYGITEAATDLTESADLPDMIAAAETELTSEKLDSANPLAGVRPRRITRVILLDPVRSSISVDPWQEMRR